MSGKSLKTQILRLAALIILYSMYGSFKWAPLILLNVAVAHIGALLALLVTHTNFSVSSSVGFLALPVRSKEAPLSPRARVEATIK